MQVTIFVGGAYLPLDVAYPSRLVHDILSDASPSYILSKTDYITNMEAMQGMPSYIMHIYMTHTMYYTNTTQDCLRVKNAVWLSQNLINKCIGSYLIHKLVNINKILLLYSESTLDMTGDWLDQVNKKLSSAKSIPEAQPMTLDNLAYVVYSSGTTGKPKGNTERKDNSQILACHSMYMY